MVTVRMAGATFGAALPGRGPGAGPGEGDTAGADRADLERTAGMASNVPKVRRRRLRSGFIGRKGTTEHPENALRQQGSM